MASALFSLGLAVLSVVLASGVDAALAFSVEACDRVVELLRRDVAGFVSGSWLAAVAFSVFGRVVRLRVVAGFACCSFISGVSDVSFMKKTPFCIVVRRITSASVLTRLPVDLLCAYRVTSSGSDRALESLFTATKKDCRNPWWGWTDPLVGAVPGMYCLRSLA